MGNECLQNSKKRRREHDDHDESSGVGKNLMCTDSDLLQVRWILRALEYPPISFQQQYQEEEAEERRLLQKLRVSVPMLLALACQKLIG